MLSLFNSIITEPEPLYYMIPFSEIGGLALRPFDITIVNIT